VRTRPAPCSRLASAHVAFTLVLCSGLLFIAQAPQASAGEPIVAGFAAGCVAVQPAGDPGTWTAGLALDSPDSSDDDSDGDAPGGDAAIPVETQQLAVAAHCSDAVWLAIQPWLSRTVDGHSLRGPPTLRQNSIQDEEPFGIDDDDDDQDLHDHLTADHSVAADPPGSRSIGLFASRAAAPAIPYLSPAPSLRAPPAPAL
jgi:hypothetical protein